MNFLSTVATALWTDDPTTQAWLAGMLGIAAVAVCFLLLPPELRLRRVIRVRRRVLRDAKRQENERDHQTRLSKTLEGSLLARPWGEFLRQWRDARGAALHDRAPVRFADALDLFPLLPVGTRTALLAALPGVFLGLGILGTFFGLVLGLPEIGGQFRHGETGAAAVTAAAPVAIDASTELLKGQIDHQIHRMTAALGLAFKTSLWGLILSMLSSLWIRRLEGGYDREANALDDVVREVFGWVGPGELEALSLRKQADAFDLLRTEFTTLSSELGNILSGGLHAIERSTAEAASLVSAKQQEDLARIVEKISNTIQSGVSQQMEGLAAAVESTRENQERIAGVLAETLQQIADATSRQRDLLIGLNATAEGLDRVAARTIEGADRVAPVVEHLKQVGGALEQAAQAARQAQEATKASLETLDGALAQSRGVVEEQRRLVEMSLGEMRVALDTISSGLGDSLVNALRQVDDVLGQAVARLSGTIHDSSETLDRLSEPVAELRDHLSRISQAVEQVGGMVTRLGPELSAGLQPVGTNLERVGSQVAELVAVMGDGLDSRMTQLRGTLIESANQMDGVFDRLGRELGSRADPLERAVTEASERLGLLAIAIERAGGANGPLRAEEASRPSQGPGGASRVPKVDGMSMLPIVPPTDDTSIERPIPRPVVDGPAIEPKTAVPAVAEAVATPIPAATDPAIPAALVAMSPSQPVPRRRGFFTWRGRG